MQLNDEQIDVLGMRAANRTITREEVKQLCAQAKTNSGGEVVATVDSLGSARLHIIGHPDIGTKLYAPPRCAEGMRNKGWMEICWSSDSEQCTET